MPAPDVPVWGLWIRAVHWAVATIVVVDLFNTFNNANYGCYNTTIENPPNPNYNTPGCAGLGRRLQLGLRYGLQPIHQAGTQTR